MVDNSAVNQNSLTNVLSSVMDKSMRKKHKMLRYHKNFVKRLCVATEYDAVAICFQEIHLYLHEPLASFENEEVCRLKRRGHTQYAEMLAATEKELLELAQKIDEEGAGFEGFLPAAMEVLMKLPQVEYIDKKVLSAIGLFYLLRALDQYIRSSFQSMDEFGEMSFGPLNHNKETGFLIYPRERYSIFSKAYKTRRPNFRTPLTSVGLGDIFEAFIVCKVSCFPGIPTIVPVKLNREFKEAVSRKKELLIASIPFIGFRTILFHNLKDDDPLAETEYPSGSFYVEYSDRWEDEAVQLAIDLLEIAIGYGSNIVIFPEFIMSKRMRKAIKAELSKMNAPQLALVLVGTTYEFNNKKLCGNNVLYILNGKGSEIGKYYKYSPFNIEKEKAYHGTTILGCDKGSWPFLCNELLSDRGKECCLLDVEMWGRILPSVCRDFIDGDYTDRLIKIFRPSFAMIPAWSPSISSFDSYMTQYANTMHVATLLCNSCDAVKANSDEAMPIACFCMPQKRGNVMNAQLDKQFREPECQTSCRENGGCVFLYRVDYSKKLPTYYYIGTKKPRKFD